jgi:hypothetical protein
MVTKIGYLAKKILTNGGMAGVLGKTSQGIYLSTPSRWVVFCTWGCFCSPLTMIIDREGNEFDHAVIGMEAQYGSNTFSIPEAGIVLRLDEDLEWFPKRPLEHWPRLTDIFERLDWLVRIVINHKASSGEIAEAKSFWVMDVSRPEEALVQQLGAGQGLTPSGDDFVIGFMLAMNRYSATFWHHGDLESLNRQVVCAGYQKTTHLSANLIEMATWGESDERLVNAMDYILGADYPREKIAGDLAGWGHSSGLAVLAGIATAIRYGNNCLI